MRSHKPGDWIIAVIDSVPSPGQIIEIVANKSTKVSVLSRSGFFWAFPKTVHAEFYTPECIGRRLIPPIPVGGRGQMRFKNYTPIQ
jgi:hypothetical protein